jgi:hypothetical protein
MSVDCVFVRQPPPCLFLRWSVRKLRSTVIRDGAFSNDVFTKRPSLSSIPAEFNSFD